MGFKSKVVVITGGAGGIGRALADQFVDEGAAVVLADLDPSALAAVAAPLVERGGEVETVVTDVTSPESVQRLADAAYARFGKVDVVCAHVGIMGRDLAPVWEAELSDWERVFAINVHGVVHTVNAFLPRMIESGQPGDFLVTSSMAGVTGGSITSAPYLASKHASRAIAENLRKNLDDAGSPIKVHVLCPGPVNTGMLEHVRAVFPEFDNAHAAVGGDGVLEPEDVARQVLAAMGTDRFYIFTHADSRHRVTDWLDGMLADLPG